MQSAALVHVTQEIQDNDDLKIMKKQKKKKKISSLPPATFHLYTLPLHLLAQGESASSILRIVLLRKWIFH